MANVKQIFFYLLTGLLLFTSCNYYISVEKRKYRDGFYVQKSIFHSKVKQEKTVSEQTGDFHFISSDSNAVAQSGSDISELEIIPAKKNLIVSNDYILKTNCLPHDTLPEKKKKHDGPQKDDERKDVTKQERNIPSILFIGIVLDIIAILLPIPLSTFRWLAVLCATLVFIITSHKIKKNNDKYDGRGFAIAGLIINIVAISLVLIFYAVLFIALG